MSRHTAEQFGIVAGNDHNGHFDFVLPMAKNEDFQSNCRLIKAAPALLEALKPFSILNPLVVPEYAGSIARAIAAIAQAEGK